MDGVWYADNRNSSSFTNPVIVVVKEDELARVVNSRFQQQVWDVCGCFVKNVCGGAFRQSDLIETPDGHYVVFGRGIARLSNSASDGFIDWTRGSSWHWLNEKIYAAFGRHGRMALSNEENSVLFHCALILLRRIDIARTTRHRGFIVSARRPQIRCWHRWMLYPALAAGS